MDRVMSYDDISTQHINVVLTSRKKLIKGDWELIRFRSEITETCLPRYIIVSSKYTFVI